MMHAVLSALVVLLGLAASTAVSGQQLTRTFQAERPVAPPADEAETLVRGNVVAVSNPRKYPATVIFSRGNVSTDTSRRRVCTATAVGPKVIYTAAHCLLILDPRDDSLEQVILNGSVGFPPTSSGGGPLMLVHVTCEIAPGFVWERPQRISPGEQRDWALCWTHESLDHFVSQYERISTSPADVVEGRVVKLVGAGCIDANVPTTGWILHEGETTVVERADPLANPQPRMFITTEGTAGLCPGDSGGAAYVETSTGCEACIVIVGTNSQTIIRAGQPPNDPLTSYISANWVPAFYDFALDFGYRHDAPICGVHPEAGSKCRRI